jgi:hypothetical protein
MLGFLLFYRRRSNNQYSEKTKKVKNNKARVQFKLFLYFMLKTKGDVVGGDVKY